MRPRQLLSFYEYREVDHRFWMENLEDWVPGSILDAHVHIVDPRLQIETITEEMKRDYWVNRILIGLSLFVCTCILLKGCFA